MRDELISKIETEKIIVIVRGIEKEKLIPLAESMYDGGIRLLEVTFDAMGVIGDEETAKNIELLVNHFGDRLSVGAGTVISEKQVELTKKAGGEFIISPDTYSGVIAKTREFEMVSMPGALTPSEIQAANRFGADFVKLFPVTNLGVDYVRAVKAPLSHIKLLAVGGINEKNMSEYLKAGVSGFGVGSNIVDKRLVCDNAFDKITKLAKMYIKGLSQ